MSASAAAALVRTPVDSAARTNPSFCPRGSAGPDGGVHTDRDVFFDAASGSSSETPSSCSARSFARRMRRDRQATRCSRRQLIRCVEQHRLDLQLPLAMVGDEVGEVNFRPGSYPNSPCKAKQRPALNAQMPLLTSRDRARSRGVTFLDDARRSGRRHRRTMRPYHDHQNAVGRSRNPRWTV